MTENDKNFWVNLAAITVYLIRGQIDDPMQLKNKIENFVESEDDDIPASVSNKESRNG